MSIEGQHSYRFGYLKSEQWKTVRIAALAREKGKCQICGEESISNDAHHIWYPENIYETTERHLVVLCRPCHDFLHVMLPDCKTTDEEVGIQQWHKFRNAILVWRREKISIFQSGLEYQPVQHFREAYDDLKRKYQMLLNQFSNGNVSDLTAEQEYECLKSILSRWWKEKKNLTGISKSVRGDNSCGISVPSQPAPQ